MPSSLQSPRRLYSAVIVVEILTVAALWLLGRIYR
jgi:hypothetical protein